jgi:hypothetical protein
MWELLSIAFEGMQPTFKHVPPSVPRFSIHAVWERKSQSIDLKPEKGQEQKADAP